MNNTLHLETQTNDPPISHKRWDKGPTNWCMILSINTLNLANLSNFIYCLCGWEVERQVPCWHRGLFLRNAYHCYNLLSYIVIATAKISTQNAHRGAEGNFAQTPHDDELQVIVRNHQQFQENCLTPQASLAARLMLKTWNGVNGGYLLNVKELYWYYATWRCWADFKVLQASWGPIKFRYNRDKPLEMRHLEESSQNGQSVHYPALFPSSKAHRFLP